MEGPLAGLAVFVCLVTSTLLGASAQSRVRDLVLTRGSGAILYRILGIVAIMAAIFMALTTASLKTSFDTAGREVKHFSSMVVELDRTLRRCGPSSEQARELLFRYSDRVMKDTWHNAGTPGAGRTLRPAAAGRAGDGDRRHPADQLRRTGGDHRFAPAAARRGGNPLGRWKNAPAGRCRPM